MSDESYDASNRADVKANATAARLEARSNDDVVRQLMRTPPGRQWFYWLLSRTHLYATTFTGDALKSAFQEGERNIGLMLQAEILRTSPDQFIQMMREAHGRDITADITRRNRRNVNASADGNGNDADYATQYVDYSAEPTAPAGTEGADGNAEPAEHQN